MEMYNNRDPQKDDPGGVLPGWSPAMIPGFVLVAIGTLFLLDNLHVVHVTSWLAYWPVIPIAIGLFKLVDSQFTGGRITGAVLLGIGGVFLADNLGYLSLRVEDLWPLILIGIGLMMLWNRTHPGPDRWWGMGHRLGREWPRGRFAGDMPFRSNVVHEHAVFGGSRRVVTDQEFKGGRIACVFGGVHLDLTGAAMAGNMAVLDISTVYGGATVRIPPSWNLEVRSAGVFGGFSDQTVHPPPSPDMKHLIVRGAAVFGGATFKN